MENKLVKELSQVDHSLKWIQDPNLKEVMITAEKSNLAKWMKNKMRNQNKKWDFFLFYLNIIIFIF